jgi:hypothetical protein
MERLVEFPSQGAPEVDGGHFGLLYHPGALFDLASRAECDFLIQHLVSAA